jgi:hypothetical protein
MSCGVLLWMVSLDLISISIDHRIRSYSHDANTHDSLGTEGLVRGHTATDTGAPIKIPVGPGTLGRIMNVTGDPIDERGPIKATKMAPIHADAPEFVEQSTSAEVLVTGIKVVDLLAPYARGGKIGLFGGAGVGKTVFIQELIVRSRKKLSTWSHTRRILRLTCVEQYRKGSWWLFGLHWSRRAHSRGQRSLPRNARNLGHST